MSGTIKGLKADVEIDEYPVPVKYGSDNEHFTPTEAEDDDVLGIVTRKCRAEEMCAVHPTGAVTRFKFDGTCTAGTEVALSGTSNGYVQDVSNASGGAKIIGLMVDDVDAADGDKKDVVFYGIGNIATK
jgi:hypothetical protein